MRPLTDVHIHLPVPSKTKTVTAEADRQKVPSRDTVPGGVRGNCVKQQKAMQNKSQHNDCRGASQTTCTDNKTKRERERSEIVSLSATILTE